MKGAKSRGQNGNELKLWGWSCSITTAGGEQPGVKKPRKRCQVGMQPEEKKERSLEGTLGHAALVSKRGNLIEIISGRVAVGEYTRGKKKTPGQDLRPEGPSVWLKATEGMVFSRASYT